MLVQADWRPKVSSSSNQGWFFGPFIPLMSPQDKKNSDKLKYVFKNRPPVSFFHKVMFWGNSQKFKMGKKSTFETL